MLNFIYHTLPACLGDLASLAVGKKMIYSKSYKRMEKILMMMAFFGTRDWNFGNENIQRLIEKTASLKFERGDLNFNISLIDWKEYFRNYIPGIKRYFFKESCENVKALESSYQW